MWNFRFWKKKNKPADPPLLEVKEKEETIIDHVPAAPETQTIVADESPMDSQTIDADEETGEVIIDYEGKVVEIDPQEKIAAMENSVKEEKNATADSPVKEEERSLYNWTSSGKKKTKKGKKKNQKQKTQKSNHQIVAIGSLQIGDGIPKICVPVTGRSREEIAEQTRALLEVQPDLVEWRVDYLPHLFAGKDEAGKRMVSEETKEILSEMADLLAGIPILFTFRTKQEGGEQKIDGADYCSLLTWAASQAAVGLVDVEVRKADINAEILVRDIHASGCRVIASSHNFGGTPKRQELHKIFELLERSGADILKVAVMPSSRKDVMKLIDVTFEESEARTCPIVTMSMGDLGRISRVSGGLTGSAITFGTVGEASAPGQLSVQDLRYIFSKIGSCV